MVTKFLNIDTDNTLSANSNERVPSQKAVKTYTDNLTTSKQNKVLDTPITVESTEETTVEGALGAINTSLSNKQNQSLSSAITVDGTQQTTVEGTLNALNIYANSKQNNLTAGDNITINNNVISAKDTTYIAGTGISIDEDSDENLVISSTQSSAEWGNITGTLSNQTDLQTALNSKYDASNPDGFITAADLPTNYVTTDTTQNISARKTFLGEKAIYFKQETTSNKLGFTLYDPNNTELGALEYRPNTINGGGLLNINMGVTSSNYVGFRYWASGGASATNIVAPKAGANYYIPVKFTDGTSTVSANSSGEVDLSSIYKAAIWGDITGTLSDQTDLQNALNAKQDTLVSGTNIKTVNGNSLLGSGNVNVDGLPSQIGQSGKFLTTDGTDASWSEVSIPQDVYTQDNLVAGTNISFTQVPQPVIDVNTIALWHLDDSLNDVISNITLGGKLTTEYHKFGTGAGYEVNEYASGFSDWTTSIPGINFLTDSFTIDGWVYFGSNGNRIFFGAGYLSGYNFCGTGILLKQSSVRALVNHTGDDSAAAATVDLTENGWYHLAVQQDYDNQKIRFFLNGTMFHEATARCQSIYGNTTVNIANPANDVRYDEIRVSNIARYPATGFTPFTQPYSNDTPPIYEVNCTLEALPSQTGQSGKFLTTDGADTSWADIPDSVIPDNITIDLNESDEIQTIGIIDQNDTTKAIKKWTGTKAEYDAIVTKDPDTEYITIDEDETVYQNSYRIGQILPSILPVNDYGLHLLDGAVIAGTGMYSSFYNYITGLVSTYPNLFISEANWQTAVTTYGVCGKFVYDSINQTIRLPKITGIIEGTTDATALGDLVQAGLPNITGDTTCVVAGALPTGAFQNSAAGAGANYQFQGGVDFDASRCSPVYGNSTTVQPQTIKVYYYIVIANSYQTPTGIQISKVASDLNGKVDKDLANCTKPYVTETYQNGTSWYRVYSDGWCEQGGEASIGATSVTFLKNYIDTNYTVNAHTVTTALNDTPHSIIANKSVSGFGIASGQYGYGPGSLLIPASWYACGYIA